VEESLNSDDVWIIDSSITPGTGYSPSYAISQVQGGFHLVRSKVTSPDTALWLSGAGINTSRALEIVESHIDAVGAAICVNALWNSITVRGSVLTGSNIVGDCGWIPGPGYSISIAQSQLAGSTALLRPGVDKMVQCYDGAYNPIPNL